MVMSPLLGLIPGQNKYRECKDRWAAKRPPHDQQPVQLDAYDILYLIFGFRASYADHAEEVPPFDLSTHYHDFVGYRHDYDGFSA